MFTFQDVLRYSEDSIKKQHEITRAAQKKEEDYKTEVLRLLKKIDKNLSFILKCPKK